MKADSQRYHEVARSQYDHEKLGLEVDAPLAFIGESAEKHLVDATS